MNNYTYEEFIEEMEGSPFPCACVEGARLMRELLDYQNDLERRMKALLESIGELNVIAKMVGP